MTGDLAALVPAGAAYAPVPAPGPTRNYAFVLVPGFTLLAFASAVEPLRIANQLSQAPLYRWRVLSETGGPVTCSAGIPMAADGRLAPLDRDTGLLVSAGNPAMAAAAPAVVNALQRHRRFGGTVGGICTGAVGLARAGLLQGRRFTLHWENQPGFVETFPDLCPTPARFEIDGGLMTCGGGAAATDMMLWVIARDHGAGFAATVADMCLRAGEPGTGQQRSSVAGRLTSRNPVLVALVVQMQNHLDQALSMDDLASSSGYSRRQIERLFRTATGQSPAGYYRGLRLDRARNLLATTNLTLIEIATACGFESVGNFSRAFRSRFGAAPSKLLPSAQLASRPGAG